MEVAGPLGTPLGLAQRKRASPRGEAQKFLSKLVEVERKRFLFFRGGAERLGGCGAGWFCSSPVSRAGSLPDSWTPLQPGVCDPAIEPRSPALQVDSLPTELSRNPVRLGTTM